MHYKLTGKIIFGDFTLLELILVVVIIAILVGIFILIFNPGQKLAEARNVQRSADVSAVLNAVYQYAADNKGAIPKSITASSTEICKTNRVCKGLVDLSLLTSNDKYLIFIPIDPTGATDDGTGYNILKAANDSITVTAPHAEQGLTISATR